jgi:hypothetical protein
MELELADGVGFEPTNRLHDCRISSPVHSTALPPIPVVPGTLVRERLKSPAGAPILARGRHVNGCAVLAKRLKLLQILLV